MPHKRHEACFVNVNGKGYLIGGRGEKPVDVYDPNIQSWTQKAGPGLELHHMQCVAVEETYGLSVRGQEIILMSATLTRSLYTTPPQINGPRERDSQKVEGEVEPERYISTERYIFRMAIEEVMVIMPKLLGGLTSITLRRIAG